MNNCLVVLNYNDAETTLRFVQMAEKTDSVCKIIVVDNCSSDDSFERLSRISSKKVIVIKSDENRGYACGNNYGCRYAIENFNPDVIFISNPDVEFDGEVIESIQKEIMLDDSVGVIAPIVNQGYNVWNLPNFMGVIESVFLIWHNLHKRKIKKQLLASERKLEYVGAVEGSFWCVKKEVYSAAGGMDERTFLYYEENLFSRRLKALGYKVAVMPSLRYNHFHSVSIRKRFGGKTKAFKYFRTGMMLYIDDYLKCNRLQKALFNVCFALGYVERFIYDAVRFVFSGK